MEYNKKKSAPSGVMHKIYAAFSPVFTCTADLARLLIMFNLHVGVGA